MVVSLTLLIIIPIVMIVTIITRVTDDDCGCRRGYKLQEPCAWVWVSVQTPEFLGNPQRKSLSHRTSPLQGPVQQQTSLISGNKGGRVSRSSKIAWGKGGVEGCEGSDVTSHIAAGAWSQLKPFATAKSAWYEGNPKSKGKEGVGLVTEGSVTLRLRTWLWITVLTLANAVICDFLSCSLWGDSLANCGSGGCINFLAQQATVFSLIDFSSQMPHMTGRACSRGFFWEDYITNLVKLTTLLYLYFHSHKCSHTGAYLGTGLQPRQSIFLIIQYLQVPAGIRLDDAQRLLVSCGSFSMIRYCL